MGKTEIVSARLHKETKEKLLATGYNPAQAIEWFVFMFSNDKERVERDMLNIHLESLKDREHGIKIEIEKVERLLMAD